MHRKTKHLSLILTSLLFFIFSTIPVVFAEESETTEHATEEHHNEENLSASGGFNAGEMIMHHIGDAHDWHLWGEGESSVSIPLPIIIYHKENGLSIFSSSKFEHGHAAYEGYQLTHGDIIAVNEDGSENAESTAQIIDLSITKNTFAMMVSIVLMLLIFISVARAYTRNRGKAPKGLQSLIEPVILFVRDDIAKSAIGEKHYARFMPFLLTIFFFIWVNNLLGLIPIFPGGANVTGNIAVPIVLATFTFLITLLNGKAHYWRHIFAMPGVPMGVLPLITVLEIAGMFIKPIVLVIRLFANITAGHIVMLVFFSLIFIAGEGSTVGGFFAAIPSVAFTIFLTFLELLVAALQAYVFTFLSAIYFGMAVAEEHH